MSRLQRLCLVFAFLALVGGLAYHVMERYRTPATATISAVEVMSPVQLTWYDWDVGIAKAREEDKLLFVHLGYPLAKGCQVMDETTFSHPQVIYRLSRDYVPVRIDRQQRPDLDLALSGLMQRLAGHAAWPVNLILSPEGLPLHGTTQVNTHDHHNQPGLVRILNHYASAWQRDAGAMREAGRNMLEQAIVPENENSRNTASIHAAWLHRAYWQATTDYDATHGGFGHGSKSIQPELLGFLLRYYRLYPESPAGRYAREMVLNTLNQSLEGELEDRRGGGFFRYCSDARWRSPYTEKLLADQARIALVLLDAYALTDETRYRDAVRRTLDYMASELRHENGMLMAGERLDRHPGRTSSGSNVSIAYTLTRNADTIQARVEWEQTFPIDEGFHADATSPVKWVDTSTITSWNGLALSAFARGASVLHDLGYLTHAHTLAKAIESKARGTRQRLVHQPGSPDAHVFAQDYAMVIAGFIDLYEADGNDQWLIQAITLQDEMDRLFWDEGRGGFRETLISKTPLWGYPIIQIKDTLLPATNAVAARNLARSGKWLGAHGYWHRATRVLHHALPRSEAQPLSGASLMAVCADFLDTDYSWISKQGDFQKRFLRDSPRQAPSPEFSGQVEHGLIFLGGSRPE